MISDSWRYLRTAPFLAILTLAACATKEERRSALVPSHSIELAKRFDFVDVRAEIPGIAIDLRYATAYNVARHAIYPARMPCLLRRETAQKLKKAQALLHAQGYGLRIWDAYRPPEAQETLHQHGHVPLAESRLESSLRRHCRGSYARRYQGSGTAHAHLL